MALIALEGFDHLTSATHRASKGWQILPGYGELSTMYARFNGQGMFCNHSSFAKAKKNLGANYTTIYFGAAFKKVEVGTPSTNTGSAFVSIRDDSSVLQIVLNVNAEMGISVHDGGGVLLGATAAGVVTHAQWHYLEGKITISASVGAVLLKIDETQVLSLTNQDTKYGSDYIHYLELNCIYGFIDTYWDDLYVDDAQFHGNCEVKTFMPDSDETHTDFDRSAGAADYECVDETVTNEDTDYIKSATLNDKSTFGITTGALETIKGIQVNNRVRVASAGVRKSKAIVRSNGADYQGAEATLSADYISIYDIWEDDPDDSNPWTQTKLEAAEFGLEITT